MSRNRQPQRKPMLQHINECKDAPLWDKTNIADATKTWFDYLK